MGLLIRYISLIMHYQKAGDHLFPRVLEEIGFEKVYEFLSIGKKVTIRSTERNFSVERE